MLTYRTGAKGSPAAALAVAEYLLEATVPTAEAHLAAYYGQDRGVEEGLVMGMGTCPMPRRDTLPELAAAVGIIPDRALSKAEFANLLQGKRADGGDWPGQARAHSYVAPQNDGGESIGADRIGISYIDLTFSAPKSVSVAWAFAPEAERQSIAQAHRTATDLALAYLEQEIAKAGFGKGHKQGEEQGAMTWIKCDHYTSRPTVAITRPDPVTGVIDTSLYTVPGNHIAGDPQLHTHAVAPNLLFTESGRFVAINRDLLRDRVHEIGAVYQAILAREIRAIGMEADLDPVIKMGRMPIVPEEVCKAFSKRTQHAEEHARETARREGQNWDTMSQDSRISFLKKSAAETRLSKLEEADVHTWREQANVLNYSPVSMYSYGPARPVPTEQKRLDQALETALPLLGEELLKRAVVSGGDARLAAARGLIDWGIRDTADIDIMTRRMVKEGVRQHGVGQREVDVAARTGLLWRVDERGRIKITTELHALQEQELIDQSRSAAADKRHALLPGEIEAGIAASKIDFSGEHGQSQRNAIQMLAEQGALAVMIGSAGTGKTKAVLPPMVSAWKARGYDVHGTALAWRQATDLTDAGIDRTNCAALGPFLLSARSEGDNARKLTDKSVIVLDELGQIGTRQMLDLLRLREKTGAKIVAMGDDKQCQSIEAGPIIELLRKALGADQIPEIFTTVRQRTEGERDIVGQFRSGKVKEAIAAKRANGTAELVEGGYRQAINRVAEVYNKRRLEHPDFTVSVSAPTNADAREISRAIRVNRRRAGQIGPDRITVEASDGRGESYQLRLAKGDNVRLFKRTRGLFTEKSSQPRSAHVGDNGSVLRVEAVEADGLRLRTAAGKVGFVSWDALRHKGSHQVALTYGDCGTIDSSQGITSDWHIHAFPGGSQTISGFKNYVAQSRHRVGSDMIGSMGAEMQGVMKSRPMGLPDPKGRAAHDEAWAFVAKNMAKVPAKESALAMLGKLTTGRGKAAKALQAGLRKQETRFRNSMPAKLGPWLRFKKANKALGDVADQVQGSTEERKPVLRAVKAAIREKVPKARLPAVPLKTAVETLERVRIKVSEAEAQAQLSHFMATHGLRVQSLPLLDGQRHYVQVEGNRGREKSGAYMAFYEGIRPAGVVWNYKTGTKLTWKAEGQTIPLTRAEQWEMERQRARGVEARVKARAAREDAGAKRAQMVVNVSKPAKPSHPYLLAKGVQPHGILENGKGELVIPLCTVEGRLMNVQTITADGQKRFLPGAKKLETFHIIGGDVQPGRPLFVAEGFATAATVHEATRAPVAVAIDTSNLGPASRALRQAYPDVQIVFAADNDAHLPLRPQPRTLPNAGLKKATEIATGLNAKVVVAPEIPERTAGDQGTDWNDYAKHHGLDATRQALRTQWREAFSGPLDPKISHKSAKTGPTLGAR